MHFHIETALLAAASRLGPIARHSADVAGNAVCDDGLMIDVSPMKSMHVDPTARTARADGGIPGANAITRRGHVARLPPAGAWVRTVCAVTRSCWSISSPPTGSSCKPAPASIPTAAEG